MLPTMQIVAATERPSIWTEQIVFQRRRHLGRISLRAAGAWITLLTTLSTAVFSPPAVAQSTTFLIGGVPYTSTACAAEWGTCRFTGTRRVAYGVGTQWVFRYATGSQDCKSPATWRAIASELVATTSLKLSYGFTKPLPSVLVVVMRSFDPETERPAMAASDLLAR